VNQAVGVGYFLKTRSLSIQLVLIVPAVVDGWYATTNSHAFARPLDAGKKGSCHRAGLQSRRIAAA